MVRSVGSPIRRQRLLRALAGSWKLASLHAPAGWGKSTLLAQWCTGRATLWVTASGPGRDPAQLLGDLLAAGARLEPPFGSGTLARFLARREFERDGGLLTAAFLHELAAHPQPIVVVVDDAHELAGARAALHWLAGLIERSPARVRFVFAGRGEALWPVARFAALGERHIAREALAFDRSETQRLLVHERVPATERRAIAERQGGWAAGLVAAARDARAGASGETAWSALAERELAPLSAGERRDVLLASALDDLEPAALAALLGPARARGLLRLVRGRGLFLDEAGAFARFHPLFLDVLRDVAGRELPVALRGQALRRAAGAYAKAGKPARALAALAAAGAEREAVRGFERSARAAEHDGALAALARGWLASGSPAGAGDSPAVRLLAARAEADSGQLAVAFEGALAAAEGWLARGRTLDSARAFSLAMTVALQAGQVRRAIRSGEPLHARLANRDRAAAAIVRARLGALRLHAGDPDAARRDLDAALRALPARLAVERAEAEMHRATVEFTAGRWAEYLTRTRRALELFRRSGYWVRAYALLVNMAEAYIYMGEEPVARRHLDEAAELAARSGLHARGLLLELSRARAFSEEGRLADAGRAFAAARLEASRASNALFDGMLDTWQGVWWRRRGATARALRLLAQAEATFATLESPAWRNVARLERALATGLAGEPARALRELAACARVSRRFGDHKEEARVLLFAARVRQRAGLPHRTVLARALSLLDRENYRVLLRKEKDVAEPLLAASPSSLSSRASPALVVVARAAVSSASRSTARAMPRVRVALLGGFAAQLGGVTVQAARSAARMLVAVLALHAGRPQRREALVELLWPGAPPGAGRNRFDVALHDARRALDPGAGPRGPFHALRSERGLVWLDASVERDVHEFEVLAEQAVREGTDAALARALAAYTGALLPEWPDAEWTEDARARFAALAGRLRLARARAAWERRAPESTLAFAGQVLASDALHEEAMAWRLRALAALGRRGEASAAWTAHDSRCRRELGSPPGPELAVLAAELGILRHH